MTAKGLAVAAYYRERRARLQVVNRETLRDLIADLKAALLRRGRSPRTVEAYGWAFDHLVAFCDAAGVAEVDQLTEEMLEDWQDELIARGLSPSSRSIASTAAKALIRHGARKHLVDRNLEDAVEPVNVGQHLPRPIAPEALQRLLEGLSGYKRAPTPTRLRDRALFLFLLTTGARVSEALQVRRDDFERPIVRQKGGTEKQLVPSPTTVQAVRDYLAARTDALPELWVTIATGRPAKAQRLGDGVRPLREHAVRAIWVRLAKAFDVPHFTTHQVRHTSATVLSGAEIADLVIAEHLGHHGLATIQNYAQVTKSRRQKVVDVFEDLVAPDPEPAPVVPLRPRLAPRRRRRRQR